jgi:hypothetical protein
MLAGIQKGGRGMQNKQNIPNSTKEKIATTFTKSLKSSTQIIS